MPRVVVRLIVVFALHSGATAQSQKNEIPSLVGVWEIVEVTAPNAPVRVQKAPPGIVIFTRSHYSITRVVLDQPRPHVGRPDVLTATAAPLRALLQFVGEAGSYERTADEVVLHRRVSLFPKDMMPDRTAVFAVECDSQTLWLTSRTRALGPIGLKLTLVRLE